MDLDLKIQANFHPFWILFFNGFPAVFPQTTFFFSPRPLPVSAHGPFPSSSFFCCRWSPVARAKAWMTKPVPFSVRSVAAAFGLKRSGASRHGHPGTRQVILDSRTGRSRCGAPRPCTLAGIRRRYLVGPIGIGHRWRQVSPAGRRSLAARVRPGQRVGSSRSGP